MIAETVAGLTGRLSSHNATWHRAIEAGGVVVGDEVKINIDVEAIEKKS